MENPAIVTKTIRFHRTAFANTLAIIATMQQHGGDLLKTTLEQSSWLPGNSKKACLYWSEAWATHLQNMTGMIDWGFAEIERLSSPQKMSDQDTSLKTAAAGKIRAPRPATKPPANRKKPATTKKSAARSTPPAKTVALDVPSQKLLADTPKITEATSKREITADVGN